MIIIGSGGHALCIISILRKLNKDMYIIDDNRLVGELIGGVKVIGNLKDHKKEDDEYIIAIGDNTERKKISHQFNMVRWGNAIDPSAIVDTTVSMGTGTVVMPGAVIQPYSIIGNHVIVNTNSCIDHECVIDNYSHIAPSVTLCGKVYVGECTCIYTHSTVIPNLTIGSNVVIGAHSNVIRNVPDYSHGYGNPFKIVKNRK